MSEERELETDGSPGAFTERFSQALEYAAKLHRDQRRKGPDAVPYIGHLLGVAGIVIANGGEEEEAIASLLHDAAEDHGGEPELARIRKRFGDRVASIVRECSDSLSVDPAAKAPWKERKETYLRHLRSCNDASVYLVSAADKLDNARATLADLERHGDAVWERFNKEAGREGTLSNYRSLIDAYTGGLSDERRQAIMWELRRIVADLERERVSAPLREAVEAAPDRAAEDREIFCERFHFNATHMNFCTGGFDKVMGPEEAAARKARCEQVCAACRWPKHPAQWERFKSRVEVFAARRRMASGADPDVRTS